MAGSEALKRSKTASERSASRIGTSPSQRSGISATAADGGGYGGRRQPGLEVGQDRTQSS
jgi:hypothetical protein